MAILNFISNRPWLRNCFLSLILLIVVILLRLPYLLSNAFFFDGDEAIVGIMAKDLLKGENFPIYFYGQSYGFATVEVFAVAIWMKVFGVSIWTLKIAGYSIFALSGLFFFLGLKKRSVSLRIRFLLLLIICSFPSWYLWAGMVRGGYLTSLLCVSVLFFLSSDLQKGNWKLLLMGMILGIAYESQVLILIPFLPFLFRDFFLQNQIKIKVLILPIVAILSALIIGGVGSSSGFWSTPSLDFDVPNFLERVNFQMDGFLSAFGNHFLYIDYFEMETVWKFGLSIVLLILAFFVFRTVMSKKNDHFKVNYLTHLMWLGSMTVVFFISCVIYGVAPRYLLGLFTGLLIAFIYSVSISKWNVLPMLIVLCLVQINGVFFMNHLDKSHLKYSNAKESIEELKLEVDESGIGAVFITDFLMQWQWNYLYGEEVPASGFNLTDRTDQYIEPAESCLRADNCYIAIVGPLGSYYRMEEVSEFEKRVKNINDRYFIVKKVDKEFIKRAKTFLQE